MQDSIYIINRTKTLNYRTAEDATAACVAAEHPCRAGGEDNWGAQGFQGCSVSGKASMLIFFVVLEQTCMDDQRHSFRPAEIFG